MRYLGPRAPKLVAYPVAAISGTILAVCSCTVLPLFASIHQRGAGLGPASALQLVLAGAALHDAPPLHPRREPHAWVSLLGLALAVATAFLPPAREGWRRPLIRAATAATWAGVAIVALAGMLMAVKLAALAALTRLAYTGLELGLALALAASALALVLRLLDARATEEAMPRVKPELGPARRS
jgi:hypothetical protein